MAIVGLLASACGSTHQSPVTVEPKVSPDVAMFTLAVQRMRKDFPRDSFFVSSELLAGGPEAIDPATVVDSADDATRLTVKARKQVLEQLGIRSGAIPGTAQCPRAPIEIDQKTDCPSHVAVGLVTGLVREGGAYLPDGGYDQRATGRLNDERAMRVLRVVLSPKGSNLAAFDLVFKEVDGTWSLLRSVLLYSDL